MKKQTLAIAIAAAMVMAPSSAFAAQDTSGMQFTSASEGFYASLRALVLFSGGDNDNATIHPNSSRIGIRGTNDLGGGLSGFYQWEAGVGIDDNLNGQDADSSPLGIRLGNVGLRGSFGELIVGSFWTADYGFTHGGTDLANQFSANLTYGDNREGRSEKAVQYTTPDLNGFQAAVRLDVGSDDGEVDGDDVANLGTPEVKGTTKARNDSDIDGWNIAAHYAIQGFSVGGSYNNLPDRLAKNDFINADNGGTDETDTTDVDESKTYVNNVVNYDDATSWSLKSGYAQDNWYVTGWYGEDNVSDNGRVGAEDTEIFSIAAGVSVDKVNLYVLYEQSESNFGMGSSSGNTVLEDAYGTLGVQYALGAQSRVWAEYLSRDLDSNTDADDIVSVGLRHDF